MPKRTIQKRFDTKEVQGEGSFVIMRSLRVGQIREVKALEKDELYEKTVSILISHILEWNWVGDDDEPLSLPKDEPTVMDELTNAEFEYLSTLLVSGDTKN